MVAIYSYDATEGDKTRRLSPSDRNEKESTEVIDFYVRDWALMYETLDDWWSNGETFESLLQASNLVAETGVNKMKNIALTNVEEVR